MSLSSSLSSQVPLSSLHHRQRSPRPAIHTDLTNPFVSDRHSSDTGVWLEESTTETQPDTLLLSGVNLRQDSVEPCQDESGGEQVRDRFDESEQKSESWVVEVQIESDLTHIDTANTVDTDTSDTFHQSTNTGDTIDQPTATSDTFDQPTDTGDTFDQPTDTGDTVDKHTATSNTFDQPTDTGNTIDQPTDTGDAVYDTTDTKRQELMSTSGTTDTGFSSKPCTTSEPDSTPPPPDHHPIHSDHTPDHASSDHTLDHTPCILVEKPISISDCCPSVLINQFSEPVPSPSPPPPPLSWSPIPPRPLSTPAKFPSLDPQAPPPKFSFPGPHTPPTPDPLEPHPPITISKTDSGLPGSKVTYLEEVKDQRSRWSEEREEEGLLFSPSGESLSGLSEEEAACEVWVATCDAHRAVLSVVGYSGQFTSLEVRPLG